jgi:beta-xylosidase
MYDCYGNGHYQFCRSEDLKTFQFVQNTATRGKFTPRHGTIIPITRAEKARLLEAFPNHRQPILEGFHADPEVLYSNKTKKYYIYSTTDGTPGWGGHDFSVFSSTNLIDWTDEGKMLDVKGDQVRWATGNAWAPAIIERKVKGGYKYYFYFSAHNPQSNRKEIGVAVSDSPTGPFVDAGAPIITDADRPAEARGGQAIDVDVFQDPQSGKYYLYWGNGFMAGAELNDDLLSVKKETITLLTPKGGSLQTWAFREGAYVFYRKAPKGSALGSYYFLWSVDDTGSPNYHVCYGTAKSPLGPITIDEQSYRVIEQRRDQKIYGTAHNSVLQVPGKKDEWYIVYHRINKSFVNREPGIHREVCIDRMTFDGSGRIVPVTPTLDGPAPLSKK